MSCIEAYWPLTGRFPWKEKSEREKLKKIRNQFNLLVCAWREEKLYKTFFLFIFFSESLILLSCHLEFTIEENNTERKMEGKGKSSQREIRTKLLRRWEMVKNYQNESPQWSICQPAAAALYLTARGDCEMEEKKQRKHISVWLRLKRGANNCKTSPNVELAIEAWESRKLENENFDSRIKISKSWLKF